MKSSTSTCFAAFVLIAFFANFSGAAKAKATTVVATAEVAVQVCVNGGKVYFLHDQDKGCNSEQVKGCGLSKEKYVEMYSVDANKRVPFKQTAGGAQIQFLDLNPVGETPAACNGVTSYPSGDCTTSEEKIKNKITQYTLIDAACLVVRAARRLIL